MIRKPPSPIPKDYPLVAFREHLASAGVQPGTASVYASAVRAALRDLQTGTPSAEALAEYEASVHDQTRYTFRTAWRHFRTYAAANGQALADVADGKPTPALAPLVARLWAAKVPMHQIPEVHWLDVRPGPLDGVALIYCRDIPFSVPMDLVQALRAQVAPAHAMAPLIPATPGSMVPMTESRLRRLAARGAA